ncbi:sugar-transfer associated ATP-grasp domain-containing protein [Sphingomonas arenae]|uniref:sugar-transfer associated ATP-grasp domain-containing protein n=1 Tax=Sphingomonas arenae TaxID=2812555 RepID=UPI0030141765
MQSGLCSRPTSQVVDSVRYWGQLHSALQRLNWDLDGGRLVEDKLVTSDRYAEHGVAAAPIVAVVGRDESRHPHAGRHTVVHDSATLARVLDSAPPELIAKPAGGSRGGKVRLLQRHGSTWMVDGVTLSTSQLSDRLLADADPMGTLIQPRLRSHPDLTPLGGQLGLCGLRITTAMLKGGPILLFHFLKLMGRPGIVDNFGGGRNGNILASIDERTGEILKAYGRSQGQRFLLTEYSHHPVTGAQITGTRLPLWFEALDLALRAAAVCPECPLAGADIALTEQGPMLLEINAAWDGDYAELTRGVGLKRMLRPIWPELAASEQAKQDAAELLKL